MARLPRLSLPAYPHHILQRGHNRQPIFSTPEDYAFMRALLNEQARQEGVAVHAYTLMENHFHLLATPREGGALARMMQGVGRRYVRRFNAATGRSGTLWEGRYRSAILQAETFLLPCMVYMDLNPVRAGVVEEAGQYAWSSHRHYVGLASDPLVTPHPLLWQLGNTPFARESAYAALVERGIGQAVQQQLVDSAVYGWVLGDAAFVAGLQKLTERRLSKSRPGRPRRAPPTGA
jgi:putative transposase